MKIIYASWEERNSGLKTCEIVFEVGDSIDDYLAAKVEDNYQYFVVKIPSDNIKLLHNLEKLGFRYMETQFSISVASTEIGKIDKKWKRVLTGTGFKRLENKNDLEVILSNVREGLFENDRISLDDKLGKEISALRYTNWIKDLYKDKYAEIFYLTKYDNKAGFFILRKNSVTTIHSIIAGIFKNYQGQGLSVALVYYYLKLASEMNAKYAITSFSSNNLAMLNTFSKTVSFKILNVYYVLKRLIEIKQ